VDARSSLRDEHQRHVEPSPESSPKSSRISGGRVLNLHALLSDHRTYERQIDRLHRRYLLTRRIYELQQEDVSLATVALNRSRVARLLATTVAGGDYRLEPARIRTLRVDGKARTVFTYRLTDVIVHGAVGSILQEAIAPHLSPQLYSYRAGMSWWRSVADFASFVRTHRRSRPDPRTRHLYVLRRDIDSYTDSIPVGERSRIWPLVRDILGSEVEPADWALVQKVIRPDVVRPGGGESCVCRGVATGQPISCVLFNLYLTELDHDLDGMPGAFYARYSDDILFAHPDADVARAVADRIDERLRELGLRCNRPKSLDLYLTGAGRASTRWPGARGTTSVPLLGTRVAADGTVSLGRAKTRALLRDVDRRAHRAATTVGREDRERLGRTVCMMINRVLAAWSSPVQQRSAPLLRRAVTDRRQLEQVDYLIARIVLRAVTGRPGARAFRDIPYRKMRDDWGLLSVLDSRNRWGRGQWTS
jgi:reverse transcriptase-like protein